MNQTRNAALTANARALRRQMTPQERKLWYEFFRQQPFTVHRQKVIGRYIADFYIASVHLAVELDGSQHYTDAGFADDIRGERLDIASFALLADKFTALKAAKA